MLLLTRPPAIPGTTVCNCKSAKRISTVCRSRAPTPGPTRSMILPIPWFPPSPTAISPWILSTCAVKKEIRVSIPFSAASPILFTPRTRVSTRCHPRPFNPDDASIIPIPFDIPSNLLRNQFTGPGINNWDVSLAKTTVIKENITFQLRFEFYNLFNRTQCKQPDPNIQDSLFGSSTSQVGQNDGTTGARQVQIGAKFNF